MLSPPFDARAFMIASPTPADYAIISPRRHDITLIIDIDAAIIFDA